MSLESLRDPLSRLSVLPVTMNVAFSPANTTNPYWDITTQYFQNDVVLSPVDDGAYILLTDSTLLGGLDPSDALSSWYSLSKSTVGTLVSNAATVTGGASPAYVVTGLTLPDTPASSQWLVTIQGTATSAAALLATDWVEWTVASAGGSSAKITFVPVTDGVKQSYSHGESVLVSLAATSPAAITVSAVGGNAASTSLPLSGVIVTCVRVA